MNVVIREFRPDDITAALTVWNEVVEDGIAFPQTEILTEDSGMEFFMSQSFTEVAVDTLTNKTLGLYILHPNNVGRCGHICNASYAVSGELRGNGIGRAIVSHSMEIGKSLGFKILQFNAVVSTNKPALKLYESLGFVRLGVIPDGFLMKSGKYCDIIPHYHIL
ncbi:MAG: GNAT family N-acetyltransferase [Clostridiales bacterium]|nr:GNAT family N-acetyltransferase [Clostridiales bacterium]